MRKFSVLLAICLAVSVGIASPPEVVVPTDTKATGDYTTIVPKTTAKGVTYVGLSGVEAFPSALLKDPKTFMLPTRGLPEGVYRFKGVASLNDEHTTFEFTVTVGKPPPPPIPVPPNPQPNPVKVDRAWVFVVEDAGVARSVDTAKMLNDPYWQSLKPKHDWRHYRTDSPIAVQNGYADSVKTLGYPAILILDAKDGTVLKKAKITTIADVKSAVSEVTK